MKRRICAFVLLIFSVVLLCGCGKTDGDNGGQDQQLVEVKPQVFTKEGCSITLTEDFVEQKMDKFVATYYSSELTVMLAREYINLNSPLYYYTVADYGNAIRRKYSDNNPSEIKRESNLTWFEYTFYNAEVDTYYYYYIYIFKRTNAFWMVEFAVLESNKDVLKDTVQGYAKSVSFASSSN